MSLFKIRPGIERDPKAEPTKPNSLPEEARLHVLCAAIAANYVKFIKQNILTALDMPQKYTIRDLQVLVDVFDGQPSLTSADIVKSSGLDPATVARSVKTLKQFGHLNTLANQMDSRSRLLELTPEGQALALQYIQKCKSVFLEKGLGTQRIALNEISVLHNILQDFKKHSQLLENL